MQVKCIYFKASGKFYSEDEEDYEKSIFEGCIYPREYGERLMELRRLPGLHSGTWDGPFVCEPEDSYPELIIPRKTSEE